MIKSMLLSSTASHASVWVASKVAAGRRIGKIDKVYTRLMLGKKAELDGRKLQK